MLSHLTPEAESIFAKIIDKVHANFLKSIIFVEVVKLEEQWVVAITGADKKNFQMQGLMDEIMSALFLPINLRSIKQSDSSKKG